MASIILSPDEDVAPIIDYEFINDYDCAGRIDVATAKLTLMILRMEYRQCENPRRA